MANRIMQWLSGFGGTPRGYPLRSQADGRTPQDDFLPVAGPEKSATVFDGDPRSWAAYLQQPYARRFDGFYSLHVVCGGPVPSLRFESRNERSAGVATWLGQAVQALEARLSEFPDAEKIYENLIAGNRSNFECPLTFLSHEGLPAEATREVRFGRDFKAREARIVFRTSLLQSVDRDVELQAVGPGAMEQLGLVWPVLSKVLLQLSYPNYPRDRFIERIAITTHWARLSLAVLFNGKKHGDLVPSRAGQRWLDGLAARTGIPQQHLFTRHPLCRLFADVSFLLNARGKDSAEDVASVIVRDYLDARYLRLSIAGLMPPTPDWMVPMPCEWKGKKRIATPRPKLGSYGILDSEDLDAWKKLEADFSGIGYFLVSQLGIGQFGRVYEAVNAANPSIPQRVAIKVDRIRKGRKKEAIEAAESIMETARGLSRSPHVIRVFDAGRLKRPRATYHILQLVEGDTLDNLIGITGTEHASMIRPTGARSSAEEARKEFLASLGHSSGEAWRRARKTSLFLKRPSLAHLLDILTSKALWVEEVHRLGFAINDLKNGNVMINRRGQFKGIDLDSYSPVFSPLDRLPDFFFLAVSGLQLITGGHSLDLPPSGLGSPLADSRVLTAFLSKHWPYGDLAEVSDGRITAAEIVNYLVDFINLAKSGAFAEEPGRFTEAINRLISIKRLLSNEEMVLE